VSSIDRQRPNAIRPTVCNSFTSIVKLQSTGEPKPSPVAPRGIHNFEVDGLLRLSADEFPDGVSRKAVGMAPRAEPTISGRPFRRR
jgi:hypothetical protein